MAEEPDIIYSSTPVLLNLSFGKNIFSFYDQNTTGLKCGIEVWDRTLTTKYGTFEAYPNTSGYYFFDLQNILKNYTTPNYNPFGSLVLSDSSNETFEFKVKYGYVTSGGVFVTQGTYPSASEDTNCVVIGGKKRYDDLDWKDRDEYVPAVAGLIGCPIVSRRVKALTDWNKPTPINKVVPVGKPGYVAQYLSNVYELQKRKSDNISLSFYNFYDDNPGLPAPTGCKNIKGFMVYFYDPIGIPIGSYELVENVISNGGGPTTTISSDSDLVYPYNVVTINIGPDYFPTQYLSNLAYIYVTAHNYYGGGSCSNIDNKLQLIPSSEAYKINIIDDECNDYPPVQVSWLNSLGFRDYFNFNKRIDESINIKRNTYEQVEGTWNGSKFEVYSYDRGEKVFSQDLTIEKTINTRYLTDYEASVLKNLYISPDVRVRYDGSDEWIPIVIKDSKWTEKTRRKDRLYQNTLTYTEAHKINSQRG